jgi:hypothetical protein
MVGLLLIRAAKYCSGDSSDKGSASTVPQLSKGAGRQVPNLICLPIVCKIIDCKGKLVKECGLGGLVKFHSNESNVLFNNACK